MNVALQSFPLRCHCTRLPVIAAESRTHCKQLSTVAMQQESDLHLILAKKNKRWEGDLVPPDFFQMKTF